MLLIETGLPTELAKNLEMFFLGTFDDETGKVQIGEPKFLCSPRELIVSLAAQKIENVKKEEVA